MPNPHSETFFTSIPVLSFLNGFPFDLARPFLVGLRPSEVVFDDVSHARLWRVHVSLDEQGNVQSIYQEIEVGECPEYLWENINKKEDEIPSVFVSLSSEEEPKKKGKTKVRAKVIDSELLETGEGQDYVDNQ